MRRAIHLLGSPRVTIDGEPAPAPRGRKAWALLAYLLSTRAPVPRERLASLLFADADDPLGALRWSLAQVRRSLGEGAALGGSPVGLDLAPGTFVDVRALASGRWPEALAVPGLGQELLEGLSFPGCPSFETWLLSERRHVEGLAAAALREGAQARLAEGSFDEATTLAARLVALEPYDDAAHELLIRAYAAAGDRQRAALQLAAAVELFRRELGREPGPGVLNAVQADTPPPAARPVSGRAAAEADLEAGQAAVMAGAADAGLVCLRRAVAESRGAGDPGLEARAMLAFAHALAWTTRGTDEEVQTALHEALALARRAGDHAVTGQALFQLGFVALLLGRYERAARWLDEADAEPGLPPAEAARVVQHRAWLLVEVGRYRAAADTLERALGAAVRLGDEELRCSCLAERGRVLLLAASDAEGARPPLEEALALSRAAGRTTFVPFPQAMLARAALAEGHHDEAFERSEHAFALALEQQDPCWQSLAGSSIGLAAAAAGRSDAADICDDAVHRGRSTGMHWTWVEALSLDARSEVAVAAGDARASDWVGEQEAFCARAGIRHFLARAHLHRHALGDASALGAAALVAGSVESSALAAEIAGAQALARLP